MVRTRKHFYLPLGPFNSNTIAFAAENQYSLLHLNNCFNRHDCLSICVCVCPSHFIVLSYSFHLKIVGLGVVIFQNQTLNKEVSIFMGCTITNSSILMLDLQFKQKESEPLTLVSSPHQSRFKAIVCVRTPT